MGENTFCGVCFWLGNCVQIENAIFQITLLISVAPCQCRPLHHAGAYAAIVPWWRCRRSTYAVVAVPMTTIMMMAMELLMNMIEIVFVHSHIDRNGDTISHSNAIVADQW